MRLAAFFTLLRIPWGSDPSGTLQRGPVAGSQLIGGLVAGPRRQMEPAPALLDRNNKMEYNFLKAWIKHDMLKMRELVEKAGSRPLFGLYLFRTENGLIRETMMKKSVSFCEAPEENEDKISLWSVEKEHPNNLGYEKMAKDIADCLELKQLIPKTPRSRP